MIKDIRYIEITFENLDYIKIPTDYFMDFKLSNIQTSVQRAAANAILRYDEVNSVWFTLKTEANKDGKSFSGDVHSIHFNGGYLFDRLLQNDITSLKLIYCDNSEEDLYVAWEDADPSGHTNILQSAIVDNDKISVSITTRSKE